MKKEIILFLSVLTLMTMASCSSGGGDDGPGPTPVNTNPTAVSQLIFPSSDLLCIDNTITFQWSASTDADGDTVSYKLIVATDRQLTNVVSQTTVSSTSTTISLQRGVAYYWNVTAMDNQGGEADPSNTYAFYTEGNGVSNHAPFTAALDTPENEGSVDAGTVNLSWVGGDSDTSDTLMYDLFFGEEMDPPSSQVGLSDENHDVTVTTGLTYYWRIDTIDDSGVRTIGQIWTFTVN